MDRIILINFFIEKFGYTNYLEIGCAFDECFNAINISQKVGVDPVRGGTIRKTSDEFFSENEEKFDIIFLDGLHHCDQTLLDIENSLNVLRDNGTIVLHDCKPESEIEQLVPYPNNNIWVGDVWKSVVYNRQRPDIDIAVGNFDYGCGVIRVRPNSDLVNVCETIQDLKWEGFSQKKEEWLRLLSPEKLIEWI